MKGATAMANEDDSAHVGGRLPTIAYERFLEVIRARAASQSR
jgi:hypothetical protein